MFSKDRQSEFDLLPGLRLVAVLGVILFVFVLGSGYLERSGVSERWLAMLFAAHLLVLWSTVYLILPIRRTSLLAFLIFSIGAKTFADDVFEWAQLETGASALAMTLLYFGTVVVLAIPILLKDLSLDE